MAGRNPEQFDRAQMMTAPESLSSLGARGIALARQSEGAESQSERHPMTAPESFSSLGFRFLAIAQQAAAEAVSVPIKILSQAAAPGD